MAPGAGGKQQWAWPGLQPGAFAEQEMGLKTNHFSKETTTTREWVVSRDRTLTLPWKLDLTQELGN